MNSSICPSERSIGQSAGGLLANGAPMPVGGIYQKAGTLNLNGVDSYVQQMVKGLIIAVAVVFDIRSKSRKTRKVILVEDEKKEK